MDYLYAPWRSKYFKKMKDKGCVFCEIARSSPSKDKKNYVILRDRNLFLVMNRYPYSPGHFMIIPNAHIDSVEKLSKECWLNMSLYMQKSINMLKNGLGADGINIGMNIGISGGAGIEKHLHYHILPRWKRDTNFITTISNTRVFSSDFNDFYIRIKKLSKEFLVS